MKKDLTIQFSYLISFFVIITLVRRWLALPYLTFWLGGVIGAILPYADYLVYTYVTKPQDVASQQTSNLIAQGQYKASIGAIFNMRNSAKGLIFHTAYFQALFMVFAFLIVSSSASLLGRGLVLAFGLHLAIDQVVDYMETKNIDKWFDKFPVALTREQKLWYLAGNIVLLFLFGVLL